MTADARNFKLVTLAAGQGSTGRLAVGYREAPTSVKRPVHHVYPEKKMAPRAVGP